ncbi:MAG: serine/threonine protein kinase, partial [Planctomycetes bacterium]|nr:serine/threonine protein kinase [Planctomycetota bacterium]
MNSGHDEQDYLDSFLESAFAAGDGVRTDSLDRDEIDAVPPRVGRYPVVSCVGRGGVGVVYRVEDPELGREVAVKVLRSKFRADSELVTRFREEARLCGRLTHPAIVTVHEIGELDDGTPYFAMRLVDGVTLASMLDPTLGRAPTHELIEVFGDICQAIAYVHDAGVVHGDLKPQNVMVGAFHEVQIMDWGFAFESARSTADVTQSRPKSGGTPAYMAPEQSRGSSIEITERTDVFGLGAILCEILTGTPPYVGELREEVYLSAARGWQDEAVARLEACGADPRLVGLARRCLDPDPENRPANASLVALEVARYRAELEERARLLEIEAVEAKATATHARRSRRLTVALAVVVVVAILVAGMVAFFVQSDAAERRLETQRIVDAALAEAAAERSAALRGGDEAGRH